MKTADPEIPIPDAAELRAAWESYCRASVAFRDAKRLLEVGFTAATEECADVIGRAQGRVKGEAKREDEIGRWADSTIDLYLPGGARNVEGRTAAEALDAGRALFTRKGFV